MSFFAVGWKRTGRVDQVPGVCHVETTFVLIGLPVAPLIGRSWLVDRRTDREISIPVSVKSVLFAYGRILLWVLVTASVVFAIPTVIAIEKGDEPFSGSPGWLKWVLVTAPVAAVSAVWGSYWVSRAGPRRAAELKALLGIG